MKFQYSKWRHGGWYVHNVRYPRSVSPAIAEFASQECARMQRVIDKLALANIDNAAESERLRKALRFIEQTAYEQRSVPGDGYDLIRAHAKAALASALNWALK